MTYERKDEIERKVFYQHIDGIMRMLEKCEDTNVVFEMGMFIGYMHKDLIAELDKELEKESSDADSN